MPRNKTTYVTTGYRGYFFATHRVTSFYMTTSTSDALTVLSTTISITLYLGGPSAAEARFPVQVSIARSTNTILFVLYLVYSFLSIVNGLLSVIRRLFRPFRFLLYLFPTRVRTKTTSENARLYCPIVGPLINYIQKVIRLIGTWVNHSSRQLFTSMAAIGRVMSLLWTMLYSALRSGVVGGGRQVTTRLKGVFIPTLGNNNGIVRSDNRIHRFCKSFLLRRNIYGTPNGMTFTYTSTTPRRVTSIPNFRILPVLRVRANNFRLQISTIIVNGDPFPRDQINGTRTFRFFCLIPILSLLFNNFALRTLHPLTIALYQISIAPRRNGLVDQGVNFFQYPTLTTMRWAILAYMILQLNNNY